MTALLESHAWMRPRACASWPPFWPSFWLCLALCAFLFSLELGLALFHEGAAAFAEIFGVHAVETDLLDRSHVAVGGVLQHLCDGDLGGLDRERRVAGDRGRERHGLAPQLFGRDDAVDEADAQRFGGIDPHAR